MEDTIQKEVNSQNLYLLFKLRSLKVTKTIAGEAVFINENMTKRSFIWKWKTNNKINKKK